MKTIFTKDFEFKAAVTFNGLQFIQFPLTNLSDVFFVKRYVKDDKKSFKVSNTTEQKVFYPTFIHIPKCGGTSIEISLLISGVRVGQYAFGMGWARDRIPVNIDNVHDKLRSYPVINDVTAYKSCSKFHTPPRDFVPNSITVIRNPHERLMSEWCHHLRFYSRGSRVSCDSFNRYVKTFLSKYISGEEGIADCHWIPQSTFAKKADIIFPFEYIETTSFWDDLTEIFSTERKVERLHDKRSACDARIPSTVNLSCLDTQVLSDYRQLYHEDMELYSLLTHKSLPSI